MTPETVSSSPEMAIKAIAWALSIDACVMTILLLLKMVIFSGIVILISRNEAHRSRKFFVFMVFFLGSILALLNPASVPTGMIRAILTAVFIGTILVKKVCWIDIEKAFLATFLYCLLTIAINIYSAHGLDLLIKDRPTIGRFLAAKLDERTLRLSQDYTFEPSPTLLSAVFRSAASGSPDEGGFVHTLFAPIRAGMKAKETIAEVSLVAEDQAAIVNMLSGAGTNVGSRADELEALRKQMMTDALASGAATSAPLPAGQIPPPPAPRAPAARPTPTTQIPPPAAAVPADKDAATPIAALADALNKGFKLLPTVTGERREEPQAAETNSQSPTWTIESPRHAEQQVTHNPEDVSGTTGQQVVSDASGRPPPDGVATGQPTPISTAVVDVPVPTRGPWADMSPADRHRWAAAHESIRISAAGRSTKSAYVMVNGHFVGLGSIYTFDFEGTNYAFRLTDVKIPRGGEWEPVPDAPPVTDDGFLTF